jgi:diguanylate cyclase (GGDEF)-like protein
MTIAKKTMLIMLLMIVILLAANTAVQQFIVFPTFQDLEHQQSKKDIDRVGDAILQSLDELDRIAYDWAFWDDTYAFIEDHNEAYIEANLGEDSFSNLRIDLAYFLDINFQPVWAETYHFSYDEGVEITTSDEDIRQPLLILKDKFEASKSAYTEEAESIYGIFFQDDVPTLFTIVPIVNSYGAGPVKGYLFFGRTLDALFIDALGMQLSTEFEITTLTEKRITMTDFSNHSHEIEALDHETLKTIKTYFINSLPVFKISIQLPRSITQNGRNSLKYALFSELAIGIVLILITGNILNKSVFFPILKLKKQIQGISKHKDYKLRSHIFGTDEICILSREFNKMLDIVEKNNIELTEANSRIQTVNIELKKLSSTDPLTGIANRLGLEEKLNIEWAALSRQKSPLAILMIDIDYFKLYNDHYGHLEGDKCIRRLAQALDSNMHRPRDMAARFGGEEFILILPETTITIAQDIAKRIYRDVAKCAIEHKYNAVSEYITISTGIACTVPSADTSIDDLIRNADKALYVAKKSGRNKIEINTSLYKI